MAGVKGRSGRKSLSDEVALQRLLRSCWKVADREAAFSKLADMANEGNIEAMKLLLQYSYGRPKQIEGSGTPIHVTISHEPSTR